MTPSHEPEICVATRLSAEDAVSDGSLPRCELVPSRGGGRVSFFAEERRVKAMGGWLCAVLFSLFFLFTSLSISSRRLLWFDEVATLRVAQLPDLATLWQYQNSFRADSAPLGYLLMVRLVYQLSGHAEIAPRLLSALAMAAALLVVFDCARRLSDSTHGLIAACVMAGSFLAYYGYEGRPYAVVALFATIALWLWLHTRSGSVPAAVAFGAAVFLATVTHYNGVLIMVPFVVWELRDWRPWKPLSRKLAAGVVAAVGGVAVCLPQIKAASVFFTSSVSWCAPSVEALARVYGEIFPLGLFVLVAFGILACLLRGDRQPMGDAERLCWLFLTIPIAGFLGAEAVTNAFYNRYLITILPGVAVAFACLASRCLVRTASLAFLIFIAELAGGRQMADARQAESIEPPSAPGEQAYTRQALAVEDELVADGRKVVVTHFANLLEMQLYSKRPKLYAMYGPDAIPLFCRYFGPACFNFDSLKARAQEIAAFYPSNELLSEMARAGFQVTVKRTSPLIVYFSPPPTVALRGGLVAEGDSITFGDGLARNERYSLAAMAPLVSKYGYEYRDNAVDGNTTADVMGRLVWDESQLNGMGGKKVYSLMIGVNNIGAGVPDGQTYSDIQSICSSVKSNTSAEVIVFTVLPANIIPPTGTQESHRQAVNALIRKGGACSYTVADVGSDPTIGQPGGELNRTYYQPDGIHPTAAGDAIIAGYMRAALVSAGLGP